MFKNLVSSFIYFGIIFLCTTVFADQEEIDTTTVSDEIQLIVNPINMLLDLGEIGYTNTFVMDRNGTPIEGAEIEIILQDNSIITIETDSLKTDESGTTSFAIIGNQEGDSLITVSNGKVSSQINVTVRRLKHYVLPYFFGNMKLNLINPTDSINYVRVQFHENSDRQIPSILLLLEQKEMKTVPLSENTNIEIMDGWVEILTTEIACGGVWTNKGFLPFQTIDKAK